MIKSQRCIDHYRTAEYPNQLLLMAKQDATLAACMGACEEVVYGFLETADMVAKEKGWEIMKEDKSENHD